MLDGTPAAWARTFALLAQAHNYIDALERDGNWRESDDGSIATE